MQPDAHRAITTLTRALAQGSRLPAFDIKHGAAPSYGNNTDNFDDDNTESDGYSWPEFDALLDNTRAKLDRAVDEFWDLETSAMEAVVPASHSQHEISLVSEGNSNNNKPETFVPMTGPPTNAHEAITIFDDYDIKGNIVITQRHRIAQRIKIVQAKFQQTRHQLANLQTAANKLYASGFVVRKNICKATLWEHVGNKGALRNRITNDEITGSDVPIFDQPVVGRL